MASTPTFRLFGFRVQVRAGFLMFMALVVFVNGGDLGFWIAGSAAVLTLLHELGHAFAARATGAEAEIALDFLAGYASFVPTRPLRWWERAGISLAGPAVQIGVSVAVLLAMGVNPVDRTSIASSTASLAIWWTGPMMGLFNLVPVLPLDGGHVLESLLDLVLGRHAHRVMLWFSVALTSSAGLYCAINPRLQGFTFFVLFPLLVQLQMLAPSRRRVHDSRSALAQAEDRAWRTGDVTTMPDGFIPSPWFRANQQIAQGHPQTAIDVLVADFADPSPPNWWPPETAEFDQLDPLVTMLPRPLPTGRLYSEQALAGVLLRVSRFDEAAHYAADSYRRSPSSTSALVVARAVAALGENETAVGWLRAANNQGTDPVGVALTIDHAPELAAIRHDHRVNEIRSGIDA